MSLKQQHNESDDKEMELETWPAFVDILSSTVVVLAFAFFILVVLLSILKITSADTDAKNDKEGGSAIIEESILLSEKTSEFQKLSIVASPTLAKNQDSQQTTSVTEDRKVILVPEDAKISEQQIKVTEVGESDKEVLGEIPKFTDSRVIEVLQELVVVQQDVISQQRKVIEQQDTQIKQTTKEYQSLLALVTKLQEVEDLRQQVVPKPDQAKFIPSEDNTDRLTGTEENTKGSSRYILSPPNIAAKKVKISALQEGGLRIIFNDNANYLNDVNVDLIKTDITSSLSIYKEKGVTLIGKGSDFSVSSAEGKRIAVDRMILLRSLLISMGVDKSLIKFKSIDNKDNKTNAEEEESYGWVEIVPNK